ncbi:MAG TPA: DoxX family protein [Methylomirabilota bacterium]|nr:DoxX family protein [Methylomirabilota bacterium]
MFKPLEGMGGHALLVLRIVFGLFFMYHGAQKLFGAFEGSGMAGTIGFFGKVGITPAVFWAWVVALLEFFGGAALVLGLLTRIVAGLFVIEMLVAAFKVNLPNFNWVKGGAEVPLAFAAVCLALFLAGPGSASVDKAAGLEKS